MAWSGNKAAVVLCMDVGAAMGNFFPGEESPFEQAKKVMTMFVQRQPATQLNLDGGWGWNYVEADLRWISKVAHAQSWMMMFDGNRELTQVFCESKDEIALVLFGTDSTENALAVEDQYQNITVHRHLMLPDFDLLEDIGSKIQLGSRQADFLDALIVCMDLIQRETIGKKFEKKHIEVFTDLSSPFSQDQLDVIICNLKKSGISLQFFLPFPIGKSDQTGNRGDGDLGLDHHGPSFPQKGITEQQKEGVRMVRRVMMSLEGEDGLDEIYSFSESLKQLCVFKKIERRSMSWPCQLTIGSTLSIRIVAYKSIVQEKVKKNWIVVDARTLKKEDIQKETVYCLNDDDETEVSKEDTIQGFRYGSDIVPFSKVDEEQMKYKSEGKCFSVLGFCRSSQVHRRFFMGNQVLKVFAAKDDEAAAVALSSLVHALDELNMVAIVRYAYDKRANPQVGVAFPYIKDAYECLVYVQLPFMEDLRQYMFSSLKNNKKFTPTEAQLSAVDDLIESMSLVKKSEEEDIIEDLFPTTKIPNPEFQRLFQCLLHRVLRPQDRLPPVQQHILSMLDPPTEMKAKCEIPLSKVKSLFPLTEAVRKKNQVTAQDVFQDTHEEGPTAKKCKTEKEGSNFSVSSLAEGNVTKVGSVNPVENFRVLVRQKIASFEEVGDDVNIFSGMKPDSYRRTLSPCVLRLLTAHLEYGQIEMNHSQLALQLFITNNACIELPVLDIQTSLQLISHIERFLETNETPYFMKSMDCIKAFREESIQFSEEQRFNSFLEALREKVEIKQLNHFWEIVVQDRVTLITKDEGPGSSVTAEEAAKFLAPKDKAKEDAAGLEEGGDVDDLLDMI